MVRNWKGQLVPASELSMAEPAELPAEPGELATAYAPVPMEDDDVLAAQELSSQRRSRSRHSRDSREPRRARHDESSRGHGSSHRDRRRRDASTRTPRDEDRSFIDAVPATEPPPRLSSRWGEPSACAPPAVVPVTDPTPAPPLPPSSDAAEPARPNFGLTGVLAEDIATGNVVNGTLLKWTEPPDAALPGLKWRLHVFKGDQQQGKCRAVAPLGFFVSTLLRR
jgi:hypothetical protein